MKKILLAISIIMGVMNLYSQSWNIVSPPDIKYTINGIYFLDANEGYFVGDNSQVLHTTDGGKTITQQTLPSIKSCRKVFFTDKQHGWIGSNEGGIYYTTNSGANWNEFNLSTLIFPQITFTYFDALCFTSNQVGFALAGKTKAYYLFKTTDGGVSWVVKDSMVTSTAQRWYSIDFYDANNGVVVGDKKNIQKYTTDGGNTWTLSTAINDAFFNMLKTVKWLGPNTIITMGEGNEFNGQITPIYKSTDGGKNWVKKTQSETNYDRVKDSYFKNANEGIGVGSNGFSKMYYTKTTNGGETWTPFQGNFATGLQSIHGAGNVLYAMGVSSHILKSTDFGVTWSMLPFKYPAVFYGIQFIGSKGYAVNTTGDFFINDNGLGDSWRFSGTTGIWNTSAMTFVNEKTGFLLKDNNHIVKTSDGGVTWRTVLPASPFSSRSLVGGISFPTETIGYAWYSLNDYADYRVSKTTDGGENWTQVYQVSGPASLSGNLGFFDANTGIMAGPKRWIQRTTNGGVSWDSVVIKNVPSQITSGDCEDIAIIDNSNAWIIGVRYILKSSDKGATWNYLNHGLKDIDSAFYHIAFKDANNGYITSNGSSAGGWIYKTTNGGTSWSVDTSLASKFLLYSIAFNKKGNIFFGTTNGNLLSDIFPAAVNDNNTNVIKDFNLSQNYPNPFNPSTIICFDLKNRSRVVLKVYDIMGREIATLINDERPAGVYNISFDAKNSVSKTSLASGVYYYRLQTDGFNETKKMLLIR